MKIIVMTVLMVASLASCSTAREGDNVGYAPTNNPSYKILDKFEGPDGIVTLFCRNGDLFVDKDGIQAGNIEFHYKHEKCVNQ